MNTWFYKELSLISVKKFFFYEIHFSLDFQTRFWVQYLNYKLCHLQELCSKEGRLEAKLSWPNFGLEMTFKFSDVSFKLSFHLESVWRGFVSNPGEDTYCNRTKLNQRQLLNVSKSRFLINRYKASSKDNLF